MRQFMPASRKRRIVRVGGVWRRGDTVGGRSGGVAMEVVVATAAVVTEAVVTGFMEMDFVPSGLVVGEEVSFALRVQVL